MNVYKTTVDKRIAAAARPLVVLEPDVELEDDEAPDEDERQEDGAVVLERPPESGKGSGIEAWREFADALHLELAEDATKAQIIEAVGDVESIEIVPGPQE